MCAFASRGDQGVRITARAIWWPETAQLLQFQGLLCFDPYDSCRRHGRTCVIAAAATVVTCYLLARGDGSHTPIINVAVIFAHCESPVVRRTAAPASPYRGSSCARSPWYLQTQHAPELWVRECQAVPAPQFSHLDRRTASVCGN